MNEFWDFAGKFWWLIFPIGAAASGAIGGIHKSMERSAKQRHKRKLEVLRLKAEIQGAKLAPPTGAISIQPPAAALSHTDLLKRLFAEHDDITKRWLDYELDVAKLIAYPAMSDGRQPLTAAFLRAKKLADSLRPSAADKKVTEQQVGEYLDAVGNYTVAFDIAERDARRLRDSTFSEAERKRLARAQQLLKTAVDESATQAERNIAYKRVREELDGLIVLSDDAVEVLEKKVAHALPGTPLTPPSAAGSPRTEAPAPPSTPLTPPAAPPVAPEPERLPLRNDDDHR